ncbi:MAG: mechanosensitive ion channel [Betaproteobacteria bacterium]|nr:mechanosensitive ion channel [Betaproteobacteria bacterium]
MRWWTQLVKANEPVDFLAALVIVLAVWFTLALARHYGARALARFAPRTQARWDELLAETVRATSLLLLLPVALYAGASALDIPVRFERFLQLAAVVGLLLQAGLWASRFLARWAARKAELSREREPREATALTLLGFAARIAVWSLVLLLTLDQLDFDITALVAGLGIGGVAVALAVQNILGDLFASLSIVLDKPFEVGDFIVVDGLRGTVERVGIKTTRVRSLDGELLVFSNADLLKSRIRNFQRMLERRVEFTIGVTYQTPPDKLKAVPQWLREAVEAQPRTRFDRAHFKEYGDSALVFEIVYYVLDRDYNLHMDVQQAINLVIFERFAREGVEFAYPTRTLHVYTAPGAATQ